MAPLVMIRNLESLNYFMIQSENSDYIGITRVHTSAVIGNVVQIHS